MNSAVEPNFKIVFVKRSKYGSREQCTGPTKKIHRTGNTQNVFPKLTLYVILIVYTIQICPAQSAYKLVLVPIANKSLVDWHHSHLNSSKIKPKLTLILISNIVITSSPKLLIIYEL